jgi:UDP-N-acetylmuramate dehydrogenase
MGGVNLQRLIKFCSDNNLSGLEALSGIPATVGGAIVMNAGAFGKNISDRLVSVETLYNGKINKYYKDQCKFGYRTSRFLGKKEVIVSATFKLVETEKELILAGIEAYKDLRKSIQPTGRSCGSVFKNPSGTTAGKLIDSLQLKGYKIGGAKISTEHANFIITEGKATATDVKKLIDYVKKKVLDAFNIELKEEIEYVGEF